MMRARLVGVSVAVAMVLGFVLAAALGPTRHQDTHLLWKATRGASTVYILGVTHYVPKEFSKIPAHVQLTFDTSSSFATESHGVFFKNLEPDAVRLKRLQRRPPYSQAPPRAWHFLNQMVSAGDIRPEQALELSQSTLYGLYVFLSEQEGSDWYTLQIKGQAYPLVEGLDHQLAALASGKKITFGLEDSVARFDFWASTCDGEKYYLEYLESIMHLQKNGVESIFDYKKMDAQIYAGQFEEFASAYQKKMSSSAAYQLVFDCFLVPRNKDWVERIVPMTKINTKMFIAVGAAHTIGNDSVQNLLAQRGFKIERVWN